MSQTFTFTKLITVTHTNQYLIKCVARKDLPDFNIKAGQTFFLRRVSKGVYEVKTAEVVLRIARKNGSVDYTIRTDENNRYLPTLHKDGHHTCTCEGARHPSCWHREFSRTVENIQRAQLRAEKAAQAKEPVSIQERGTLGGNRPFSLLKSA